MNILIESKGKIVVPPANSLTALAPLSGGNIVPAIPASMEELTPILTQEEALVMATEVIAHGVATGSINAIGGGGAVAGGQWFHRKILGMYIIVGYRDSCMNTEFIDSCESLGTAKYAAQKACREGFTASAVMPPYNDADYSAIAQGILPEPVYTTSAKVNGKSVLRLAKK